MEPADNSLEESYQDSAYDSTLESNGAAVVSGASQRPVSSNTRTRASYWKNSHVAFRLATAGLIIVGLIGLSTAGVSLFRKDKAVSPQDSNQLDGSYAVTSLPIEGLNANQQLSVGQADHLAINGQLEVNSGLVIAPSGKPTTPVTGQVYYDKTTNQPYYYNGTQFIGLAPSAVPVSVTSLGGVAGSIGLGTGLQISGGQLAVASSLLQAVANAGTGIGPHVSTLQGLTGNVTLSGGTGISISGTTITNNGVVSLTSSDSSIAITPNGNGSYDLVAVQGGPGSLAVLLGPLAPQQDTSNGPSQQINKTGTGNFIEFASSGINTFVVSQTGQITSGTITYSQVLGAPTQIVNTIDGVSGAIALGTGLSITGNTLSAQTGVVSISGTANQITAVDSGGGNYTLSLPQDIAATSSPTFGGATLNGALSVSGAATLTSSLNVSGATTLGSSLSVGSGGQLQVTALGNLSTSGNGSFGGTLGVTGTTTLGGALNANGVSTFGGNVSVTGSHTFTTGTGTVTLGSLGAGLVQSNASGVLSSTTADRNSASLFTGTLSVGNGGTGANTLTANGVLYGNGSSAVQTATGTGGQVLLANALGVPVFTTVSGDVSLTNTGGTTVTKLQNTSVTFTTLSAGDVLQYDGSGIVNGHITNTNLQAGSFTNITGVGALTSGSIGSGFGVISTGNNITTTATVQGATVIASGSLQGNTLSINSGAFAVDNTGAITAVSGITTTGGYTQTGAGANSFSGATSFGGNVSVTGTTTLTGGLTANGGITDTGNFSQTGTGTFSTGTGAVSLNGATTITGTNNLTVAGGTTTLGGILNVTGQATFSSNAAIQGGALTLGVAGSTTGILNFANTSSTNLVSLQGLNPSGTGNATIQFPSIAGGTTDQVCLVSLGNCAGSGSGVTASGGSAGYVPVFTGGTSLTNSIVFQNGTSLGINTATPGAFALNVQGGDVNFGAAATVANGFTVTAGASNLGGALTVGGATSLSSTLDVTGVTTLNGNTSVTGTKTFTVGTGATSLGGILGVTGATTLSSTLGVTGAATFTALLTANGGITDTGSFSQTGSGTFGTGTGAVSLNGNTSVTGSNTLTVGTGTTTLGGALSVNGLSTLSGGATVTGATNINTTGTANTTIGNATGNFSVTSSGLNISTGGALTGVGGITTNGAYTQSGVSANTFSGATTFTGAGTALTVNNDATITGTATIGTLSVGTGGITSLGTLTVSSSSPSSIAGQLNVTSGDLVVGVAGSVAGSLSLANTTNSNLGVLKVAAPTGSGNATYTLPALAGGTGDTICLATLNNCGGSPNTVTTSSNGTTNALARFTGTHTIADSAISDDGSSVTISELLNASTISTATIQSTGALAITPGGNLTVGATSHSLALQGNGSTTLSATSGGFTTTVGFVAPTANNTINFPNASGTVCLQNSVSCGFATSGSGVTSVNSQTGAVIINNATGATGSVTIDDASTTQKGIAQFNSTNFSSSLGVINTIQGISTTSSVQFGNLTLGSGGNLTLSNTGQIFSNNLTSTGSGNITIDATTHTVTFLTDSGANSFVFPSSGGLGQTICTSGITCASGGGQALLLEPSGVQSGSANRTAIFVNKAGGTGNLIQLQAGGSDALVIDNSGNTTINNSVTIAALTVTGTVTTNVITPTAAFTAGATGQQFTLQGSGSSVITATNSGFTTTVGFSGTPTAAVRYNFAQNVAAGTYTVCTTVGNCAGTGGGVTTAGGTTDTIAKFSSSGSIADSVITENSGVITVGGSLNVGTSGSAQLTLGVPSVADGTLVFANSTNGHTITLQQAGTISGDTTVKLPTASGTIAVSASGPIQLDALTGQISCPSCLTGGSGGGGGVTDITGTTGGSSAVSGNLTLNNALTSGSTITLDDASTTQKGIAQFNSTNFSSSLGVVNLIQDIATTSSPTFANLSLQGATGLTIGSSTNLGKLFFKDGTADGFTTGFSPSVLTANRTLTIPNANGTLAVSASGNLSLSATGDVSISNAPNFTTSVTTPSLLSTGALSISAGGLMTIGSATQPITVQGTGSTQIKATDSGNTTTVSFVTPTANNSINFPNASGTVCLQTSASCGFAAASNVVNTLNGLTGTVSVANATVGGSTITINDASTTQKGIAQFNSTNFSVTTGVVNTIQDIASTSSPTFNGLTTNGTYTANGNISQTGTGTFSTGSGAVTLNGDVSITGTKTLTVGTGAVAFGGTLGVAGLTTLSGGATVTGTTSITGGTSINTTGTANTSIGNATGSFSLVSSALNITTAGALSGITGYTQASGNFTQNGSGSFTTGSGAVTLSGDTTISGTKTLNVGTGATTLGGSLAVAGTTNLVGVTTLGTAGSIAGVLNFANTTNSNLAKLVIAAPTGSGTATYTLPAIAGGSSDTVCLATLANCAGSANTLQTAYNASTGGTTPEIKVDSTRGGVDIQDANTSIGSNLFTVRASNSSGLGSALFNINSTGQVKLQNSTDSANAFELQNVGASSIFKVNTLLGYVGIDQANAQAPLHVGLSPGGTYTNGLETGSIGDFTLDSSRGGGGSFWRISNTVSNTGTYSAYLPDQNTFGETSGMSITKTLSASGTVSYYRELPTLSGGWSYNFYIDGVLQESFTQTAGFVQASFAVASGTHTFRWEAVKPCCTASNFPVYVDDIAITNVTGGTTSALFDGNVGIGNTSPSSALDVTGTGKFSVSVLTPSVDVASAGTLSVGTATATAVSISKAGVTTTVNGALTVTQATTLSSTLGVTGLATFNGGATLAANQNLTLTSGTGTISQTFVNNTGTAETKAVTDNASSGTTTVNGLSVNLTGTNNAGGSNTLNALNFGNVIAATNNTFNGLNFGTGYSSLLTYNGTNIISGTGVLQSAGLSGTYSNALTFSNASNSFTGNGSALTSLNGSSIASGTVGVTYGGTGVNGSSAANGSLLIGNGSGYSLGALGAGTGISITNGSGTISVAVDNTVCLTSGNCSASGTAGGDLTGTYPNPTIAKLQGKTLTISGSPTTGGVLQYNGSAFVDGLITNTNLQAGSFGNITGVGALTSGSIASGFGTISTGSNITTSTTVQGATVNATSAFTLGGTDINTGGTLNNVAYLDQANIFTGASNTFNNAVTVKGAAGLTLGVASSTAGKLTFASAASANLAVLQVIAPTGSGTGTYTLPAIAGGTGDTICLVNLNNCPGSGASSVGLIDAGTLNANGASIASNVLYLQSASATWPGLVTTGAQTFAGAKTFNGAVVAGTGLTVTTNGLTVSAGGITVTGNSTITGTLSGLTGLTIASGGANITGGLTSAGATTLSALSTAGVVHNSAAGLLSTSLIQNADLDSSINYSNLQKVTNLTASGTLGVTGLASFGTASSADGQLKLYSATNTGSITIQGLSTATNATLSFPAGVGSTDTFCLQTANNCSGTAYISAVGAVDGAGSPNANGLTVSSGTLYLNSASATQPGVINATTQTFGGAKTFNGAVTFNSTVTVAASQSLRLIGDATANRPASPSAGTLFYDTSTNQLIQWNGTKWVSDHSSNTKIIAASNSSQADKDAADVVATGTGDQGVINTALTAAAGGSVYLMEGTYNLSAAISVPNNTTLAGAGAGTIITVPNAQNGTYNMITNTDTTTGTHVNIRDLRIDGNKANQSSGDMKGIYFNGMGGGSGVSARDGGKLSNLYIANVFGNNAAEIYLTNSNNNTLGDNTVESSYNDGIVLAGSAHNTLTGNIVQGSSWQGIWLSGAGSTNNTITGNTTEGNNYGISLSSSASNNTISGNTVHGNSTAGIKLASASTNIVSANKIDDNGGSNNNGIFLTSADANIISSNDITDTSCATTCYAINIFDSTSDNNYLADNRFSVTSGTPTINDAGTGTVYANQSRAANGGQLTVKTANDAASFQIQNATGTAFLTADTSATSKIQIGSATTDATAILLGLDSYNNGTDPTGFAGAMYYNSNLNKFRCYQNSGWTDCITGTGVTSVNTFTGALSILGTANQITVTNSTPNITLSLPQDIATSSTVTFGSVKTATLDTASAVTLNIGATSSGITLNKNVTVAASQSLRLIGDTTANRPSSPSAGTLFYDTTTNQLIQWNGTKWVADKNTTTKIIAASNSSQAAKDAADVVATGTGDQGVINTALTAAAGGTVYLMEGTYNIASPGISIPNNTTLAGAGAGTLITIPNAQNGTYEMITNSDTSTGTNVSIRDLKIDGNKANQTSGTMNGIHFINMGGGSGSSARNGAKISNLIVSNVYGGSGINLSLSNNNTVTGNTTIANAMAGIYLNTSSNNTIVNNVNQGNSNTGIYLLTSTNNTISANVAQGSGANGILLNSSSNNNTVTGNTVPANLSTGIGITNTSNNNTIGSNKIDDSGDTTTNNGIYLGTSSASNTITGNDITDSSCTTNCYAINVSDSGSSNNYLAGNRFSVTSGTPTINDAGTGTVYANQARAANGGQLTVKTANDAASFQVQNATGTAFLTADTSATSKIQIGSATTDATAILLGLDNYNNGTDPTGFAGAMYYNSNLNKFRCYENGAWVNCIPSASGVTSLNTFTGALSILGTANQITVTNSTPNITLSLPQDIATTSTVTFGSVKTATLDTTSAVTLNIGATSSGISLNKNVTIAASQSLRLIGDTTLNRPSSPSAGTLFYDTTTNQLIQWNGSKWVSDRSTATKIVGMGTATGCSGSSPVASANADGADYTVTSCTSAQTVINSALAALPAGGGTVYLMEGTYIIDGSINVPNNTTLAGAGASTVIKFKDSVGAGTFYAITNSDTTTGTRVTIQNLRIDGNKANNATGSPTMTGLYLNGLGAGSGSTARDGGKINNVTVRNMISTGILISASGNNVITDNVAQGNSGEGIRLASSSSYNTVTGNLSQGNDMGINLSVSTNNTITGNTVEGSSSDGILMQAVSNSNTITGNTIVNNSLRGIELSQSDNNTIGNNKVDNNGGNSSNHGIYITNADSNTITGNDITDTSCSTTCYAINVSDSTSDTNYLANNRFGTPASIQDLGTGTIFSNQMDGSGNLINRSQGGGLSVGKATAAATLDVQGGIKNSQLSSPSAPTLSIFGAAGATSRTYAVSALDGTGETLISSTTSFATTANTLDGTHYVIISWPQVSGAVQYKIYRTVSPSNPATTGLIGTVNGNVLTFNDTGIAASGSTPAANTTGGANIAGLIQGGSLSVTGVASFGTASSATGQLKLYSATNTGSITIQGLSTAGNYTVSFPGTISGNDTFCLQTANNCATAAFISAVGAVDGAGSPNANGLTVSSGTLYLNSASATQPGVINATTQSFGGNKTFTGLTVLQPSASLTNGQIGLTQTATFANATASGTVKGFVQNLTVNSSTAATNIGTEIDVTDNSTTTAHVNTGLKVVMSGSNTSQSQIGLDVAVSKGIGGQFSSTGTSGASQTCGPIAGSISLGLCASSTSTTNGIGLLATASSTSATLSIGGGGAGAIGNNTPSNPGAGTYIYGLQGMASGTGAAAAYTSIGVYGEARTNGGTAYGGYFTTSAFTTQESGAALYATNTALVSQATNGLNGAAVFQLQGGVGGITTGTTGQTAGSGSGVSIATGAGGAATGASGTNTGGAGGAIAIQGGNGGNATSGIGGAGAAITLTAGNGGNGTGANANGAGGNITLVAGSAGTGGTGGSAGNVIVKNAANSASAFQIQNTSSVGILNVDTQNGRVGINTSAPSADLTFGDGANRTINVLSRTTAGNGYGLTIQAGNANTANNVGGDLVLQGGAGAGAGASGSVIVRANTTGSTNVFQVQDESSGTLFNVSSTNGRTSVGNIALCTTGRFCVGYNTSGGAGGTTTNSYNFNGVATTAPATVNSQSVVITDTSSAIANTLQGIIIDTTGTTNNSATVNGIVVKGRTQNAGSLLNLQTGGSAVFDVSNTGATSITGTLSVTGLASFGTASSATGQLKLYSATNTGSITVQGLSTAGNYTVSFPGTISGADTFCLQTAANCGGTPFITAVGAVDAAGSPNANGLTVTSGTLNLNSASGTQPGVVNATTQTFGGNKTFTGLTVLQPTASLTNGQFGLTQTATLANATASGNVEGFVQNLTVNGTVAATNIGHEINVTDNSAGSPSNINTGLKVALSGSNLGQVQIGVDISSTHGLGLRAVASGSGATGVTCADNISTAAPIAVCADNSNGSGAGVYARSAANGTSLSNFVGSGVYGTSTSGGAGGNFYAGVRGISLQSNAAAYTSLGVYGQADGGAGATTYGGYFTTGTNGSTSGAALYSTTGALAVASSGNGINAINVLQAAGGAGQSASAITGVTAGSGAAISLVTGAGGAASGASGANVAGAGGTFAIQGGNGGLATSGTGGAGAAVTLTAGTGGNATAGTGGAGAGITLTAGNGGNGTSTNANGNGGNITLVAGNSGTGGSGGGSAGSVIVKNAANSTTSFVVQNAAGNQVLGVDTSSGTTANLTLGRIAASGSVTQGKLILSDGTTDNFGVTLQSATITTSSKVYTIPNSTASTDTFCLVTLANCSGGSGFITAVGAVDAVGSPNANGLTVTSGTLNLNSASGTQPGVVNATTQTFGGNKTFTGLTVLQPTASLTNGQVGLTQTATFANATASGTVQGFVQNLTVSSSTAATNTGTAINITDNSTTTAHTNVGLKVVMSGTNANQLQYGVDASATAGIGVRGVSSGAGAVTCGTNSLSRSIGLCGYSSLTASNTAIGVFGETASANSSGAATANAPQSSAGVNGFNAASTTGGGVALAVRGLSLNSSTGGTTIGVNGLAESGAGGTVYGGYFAITNNTSSTLGAALYATTAVATGVSGNGRNAVNVLQAAGGAGQATTGTSGQTAGSGAAISLVTGVGGDASGASGANTAGAGGTFAIQGGNGGLATSGTGGAGAAVTLTAGTGGNATAGTGGAGAGITLTAGNGGNGTSTNANGNGGNITLVAGNSGTGGSGGGSAGSVIVKNAANSTVALQVQTSTSTPVLTVDTSNSQTIVRGKLSSASLGSELVTSQDFTSANWSTCNGGAGGWSGTTTTATHNTLNTISCSATSSNFVVTAGATYQITFTVAGNTTATNTVTPSIGVISGPALGANTTHTVVITASNTNALTFTPTTSFNGVISNISVKLITFANSALTVQNSSGTGSLEVRSDINVVSTFIGLSAGQSNSTGTHNTGIGALSLQSNTSGGNNTATGYESLNSNTTGLQNTANGAQSLQNNTTGGNNTASGYASLNANLTGADNSAFGASSLVANLTGGDNTAIGYTVLQANTIGSSNTGLGSGALSANTTGSSSVGLGASSLQGNTTGGDNTAIGVSSLKSNTTGSNNTALGFQAGYQDTGAVNFYTLNNLTNATAIGYSSQVQQSNSLILGGQGSNAVNVGIGTTMPDNTLSVSPVQYSAGTAGTGGVSSTTVTGAGGAAFTAAMIGSKIIFANGSAATTPVTATITAVPTGTTLTVTPAITVATGTTYRIQYQGFQVTSAGKVGIGTSAPTADLQVNSQSANAFQVQNAAGTTILNADATTSTGTALTVTTGSTTNNGLAVKAVSSQGAGTFLFQLLNSSGNAMSSFNANGDLLIGGANSASSATAFKVQNTSGNEIITADSSASQVLLGKASTLSGKLAIASSASAGIVTLTVGTTGTSYSLALPTTGVAGSQCLQSTSGSTTTVTALQWGSCGGGGGGVTRTINIVPEYPGAVVSANGQSSTSGTLTTDFDSTNNHNYYSWLSSLSSLNTYDVVLRTAIPSDYTSTFANLKLYINAASTSTANDDVQITVKDGATACNTALTSILPGSTGWQQQTVTLSGCTFAANDILTISVRMSSKSSNEIRVGEMSYTYTN